MSTMAEMIRSIAVQYSDRTAVVEGEMSLTYGAFLDRVQRTAGMLQALGLKAGERFGIISPNSPQTSELFYGGYWSGIVPVPINIRMAPPEIRHILEDAEINCLFIAHEFHSLLDHDDLTPWREKAKLMGTGEESDAFRERLNGFEPAAMHTGDPDDEAILLYTGGTTGKSKGVPLTHGNIISDALQCAPSFGPLRNDVYLHAAPMFHSADLLGTIWYLFGGAHVYMPAFSPKGLLETISRFQITFTMLPPTMIILALQVPDFHTYNLSSLRGLIYGSSPMAVEWIRRTTEAFPDVELHQGYGLTETSPLLSVLSWEIHQKALKTDLYERLKSCGRAIPGVELEIVDDMGENLPAGEVGEVVARGANITRGYLNRDDENRRTFRKGWFHTGDVGRKDRDGFIYLMDRKKDMIVSGGENIYTSEVEAVLYQHADVYEAAVIGVPDEKFGEALLAVIVLSEEAEMTPEEIIFHCRGKIGGYKIPKQIQFVDSLPKSALGKVLKTELRKRYSQ
jgi:long-chain acyl-CoA synthetase